MDPAGMVHALHTIAQLLKPRGVLIDIHPSADQPEIHVHTPAGAQFAGTLEESDDFIEYVQAQTALEQAISNGIFILEHQGQFAFALHAESLVSLQNFLAESWKDAVLSPGVIRKIEALFAGPPPGLEAVVTEQIVISRLRRK
jgi:hypothetical protein